MYVNSFTPGSFIGLTAVVEGKYGCSPTSTKPRDGDTLPNGEVQDTESSTDSEEEDDEGILASEALDAQIQDTLEAIRAKDPRVYSGNIQFYTDPNKEEDNSLNKTSIKKEKPMFLSDYHRKNLLEETSVDSPPHDSPISYVQQQDTLKNTLVKEMHAAAGDDHPAQQDAKSASDSADEFLVRKRPTSHNDVDSGKVVVKPQELDVETANKDPETYLSNFMASRAWIPSSESKFQPFESDDEEEERRAELFEDAYNMRFEDPNASNEKILSHARDAAVKYSVRKEMMNPRKKARNAERDKKEMAKLIREEEKARLRKLKVTVVEEKLERIRESAGLPNESLQREDWSAFLGEGWDDAQWELEMTKHFGNDYYANNDTHVDSANEGKRKIRKPKWDDDIDINDLVPEFEVKDDAEASPDVTRDKHLGAVSDVQSVDHEVENVGSSTMRTVKGQARQEENERKIARRERRKVEQLVDRQMVVDESLSRFGKKHGGHFRYRDTSPTTHGLTAHDILMASDSQLNQYAGLKKLATFRDSDKKRKDKRHLGKKARLRQWRKETFGSEDGPRETFAEALPGHNLIDKQQKENKADNTKKRKVKRKDRAK